MGRTPKDKKKILSVPRLDLRKQKFAALVARGNISLIDAAVQSGYARNRGYSQAWRLWNDPEVQEAIRAWRIVGMTVKSGVAGLWFDRVTELFLDDENTARDLASFGAMIGRSVGELGPKDGPKQAFPIEGEYVELGEVDESPKELASGED